METQARTCPICANTRLLIYHPTLEICKECRDKRQMGFVAFILVDGSRSTDSYVHRVGRVHWVLPIVVSAMVNMASIQKLVLNSYLFIRIESGIEQILLDINNTKYGLKELAAKSPCQVCNRTALETCDRYTHPQCMKRIDN